MEAHRVDGGEADRGEIDKFDRIADRWWDAEGPFKPLHRMQPARLDYAVGQIAAQFGLDRRARRPLAGIDVLDVGCGGGLMTEPMARLGARAVGVDASEVAITAARAHADAVGLGGIDYRVAAVESVAAAGERFDVVLAFEIIEHVPDPAAFLAAAAETVAPEGLLIVTTLNRTAASFLKAIVGAEFVLGWLPRGTHDWRRFPTPDDVKAWMSTGGLTPVDAAGFVYDPLGDAWSVSATDLSVNYAVAAVR